MHVTGTASIGNAIQNAGKKNKTNCFFFALQVSRSRRTFLLEQKLCVSSCRPSKILAISRIMACRFQQG